MNENVLKRLCCAACRGDLCSQSFEDLVDGEIEQGVVWCAVCRNWYPIVDGLLELLPPKLAYHGDRKHFWKFHRRRLETLDIRELIDDGDSASVAAQRKQQEHFDWYASNAEQTYNSYEQMPFWRAVDTPFFDECRQQMRPDKWLLDVGCAQGRSTFPFMDLPLNIVGFDISKALIRQAITHYRQHACRARATFFVADGSRLPFKPRTFDYVLIYGVLHHLPDPRATCAAVARILKPGGIYFGSENNQSCFRRLFDLVMRLNPIWHEEAGAQPLISARQLCEWFADAPVEVQWHTQVFILPHLVNWLGPRWGTRLFRAAEWIGQRLPGIRHNGGLIVFHAQRQTAKLAPSNRRRGRRSAAAKKRLRRPTSRILTS
jgi:2-polyprenyl-3-methyl-5-hydroxy-6-metoxy-1,4-benzoquinol methylase/uncharacterized protein YbaR (Trm112 family)